MDNKKYYFFCLSINPQKESTNPHEELMHYQDILLTKYNSFIATIIHDKDVEDNKPKTLHAHVFIKTVIKATCKQTLTQITELLGCNANQIQIQGTNNEFLQIQYLTHKNDKTKHQYDYDSIRTNNPFDLEELYNKEYKSKNDLKTEEQRDVIECKTILELIGKQGLEFANKYRNTFNQIKHEQHIDYDTLMSYIETYEKVISDLKSAITRYTRYDGFIEARIIDNLLHNINFN